MFRPFYPSEFERPTNMYRRPGKNSWYSDSLCAGRSWVRLSVLAKFSLPVQDCSEAHLASCIMAIESSQGEKRPGRGAFAQPLPTSRLQMVLTITSPALFTFISCHVVDFVFSLLICRENSKLWLLSLRSCLKLGINSSLSVLNISLQLPFSDTHNLYFGRVRAVPGLG